MRGALQWMMKLAVLAVTLAVSLGAQSPDAARAEAIGQLRCDTSGPEVRHVVRGVVSRVGSPLYIQDRTGGMEVALQPDAPALRIGDEVVAEGELHLTRYATRLERAQIVVLAPGVPEPPVSITASMASSGNYDRMFVETEGILRGVRSGKGALWLLLDGGREPFVAEVPVHPSTGQTNRLAVQSRVRVRGICMMDDRRSGEPVAFTIITTSIEDVVMVTPPPFWNRAHVLELIGCMLVLGLACMVFYVRLERWRFGLILDERTRMAHDLHDTLAQSFTGVAYQLQAIRNAVRAQACNVEKQVTLAIAMVADSQEDARRSIAMLKPADLDTGNVLENLRQQGEALTHGGPVQFTVHSKGDVARIPQAVGNILLRIGHEAITNALRHAHPANIAISLDVMEALVALDVADDGSGFAAGGVRMRGFGIRAMHARAHSYGGSLEIVSEPDGGTTVQVRIPLRRRRARLMGMLSILREERRTR